MTRRTIPGGPALRLPAHRASSVTLAGAYPFLVAPSSSIGVPVGTDALTGEPFCFDPWDLYAAGTLTNPNVLLAGVIGQGKSALAKTLALRSIAVGRRVYVPGDPKGEWGPVAHAVGGVVVRLGPGLPTRLNPLDVPAADSAVAHTHRLRLLVALAATALRRDLAAVEHTILDTALSTATRATTAPTLPDVVTTLDELGTAAGDGRDLAHGLRRLVRGDLAGMFDGLSTYRLDADIPMVVLDLSALGGDDEALELAMTCAAGWLDAALTAPSADSVPVRRWVIYDEAWRLLRSVPLIRRLQSQWKLSRAYGIANVMVLHRLSDLDAVGAAGSEARALAEGLLADCSTRIIYRQEADQITATGAALGLTRPEREVLAALPRGVGLWKMPGRSHIVRHHLHADELAVVDTDAAMRGIPNRPQEVA